MIFENKATRIIVTGGAGFIGSALIRKLLEFDNCNILNLDKYGYASDLTSINQKLKNLQIINNDKYQFLKVDICDSFEVNKIIQIFKPDIIFNLAAETHVDRSIEGPYSFVQNNVFGTYSLLEGTLNFWNSLRGDKKNSFRLIHISTDEVFGSIDDDRKFNEKSPYLPNSPYSASKASSDHLVRAWNSTYNLPTIITNCSNNFGPWQFPEKLIPNTILKALNLEEIPVYGNGENIRDWLFVEDHVEALIIAAQKGKSGKNYCIGGDCEKKNIEVVNMVCNIISELKNDNITYSDFIKFVEDRPGHDFKYSVDISNIKRELKWSPKGDFNLNLLRTVKWYCKNLNWCKSISKKGNFNGERLGTFK